MKWIRAWMLATLAAVLLGTLATGRAAADDDDPPSRVARLSYMSGSVSFQPGGQGDWLAAVWNRPLTTGDNLWTDRGSRAELHVGSTAIRMGPETSLTLLDLDDRSLQLRLSAGTIVLRVRHVDDGDFFEIDTPNLAFVPRHTGEYRIDVDPDGDHTVITDWKGRGEVTGGGASYTVVAGQRATFSGTDYLDHEIDQIGPPDDFENWAFSRDQREDRADSGNYVSQDMTGYEDLDDYGRWHYVAGYGPVWTPVAVAPGWAPYRFGHWIWVAPWGWTWVEDEPWGFTPFHYGRWALVEGVWCWVPGPVVVRPVYAPALVAFVGGGGFRFSLSFGGGGGVAWFPLAPGEVYVPAYRVSRNYVNNVNITNTRVNVTQVTNVYNTYVNNTTNVTRITYVNQQQPNAVTAVARETFVNARPVASNLARVDPREMAQAPVTHAAPVEPVKASTLGAGNAAKAKPPERIMERKVVAVRTPPPPAPVGQPATVNPSAGPARPQPSPPSMMRQQQAESVRGAQEDRPMPRPQEAARPQAAPQPPHPAETTRTEERVVPQSPQPERNVAVAPHPLVKPAPPVQDRPQHEQNEAAKFRTWQEQHQKAQGPPPRPSEREAQNDRKDSERKQH